MPNLAIGHGLYQNLEGPLAVAIFKSDAFGIPNGPWSRDRRL